MNAARIPRSATGRVIARSRHKIFHMTGGKCFYCAGPVVCATLPQQRDWLFPRPVRHKMQCEHKTPTIRGGADHRDNYVPACLGCNNAKGAFTIDEFRFIRGLQEGNPNFRFPFEREPVDERDWLCTHSPGFAAALLLHNMPAAVAGFEPRRKAALRR